MLADISIEEQVRLMLQNAHQIHTIVKEAFPVHRQADQSLLKDCNNAGNDGVILTCLWSNVTATFKTEHRPRPAKSLHILANVSRYLPKTNLKIPNSV